MRKKIVAHYFLVSRTILPVATEQQNVCRIRFLIRFFFEKFEIFQSGFKKLIFLPKDVPRRDTEIDQQPQTKNKLCPFY